MPTGQVFRWHWRAITQPSATRAAVPKSNSSAPSRAARTTSRPLFMPPSTRSRARDRSPLAVSAWWVSGRASSQGKPVCLSEPSGLAPVPPSPPQTSTTSAPPLTTPQAMVPMPGWATSLTETRQRGLTSFRSKMSWARSSML